MVKGWGANTWGSGEGQSFSVADHIFQSDAIHKMIWGQSYEDKYKGIGKQLGQSHAISNQALQHALGAIREGYGGAQGALNMQGAFGTKQLLDREKSQLASSQQSMIGRGLYGSTATDAASRGIAADTNNSLAGWNAQLAKLGADLNIGQGHDVAGAYGNIANEEQNYAQMLLQLGLNTQYGQQGGAGGAVAGILGSLSDRRLKTNIELVGLAEGIPIYDYNFVPEAKIDGRWRGVLADEVEHLPGVVSTGADGYKRVDYSKLGFHMMRVSEVV